ncbi:unnamed protein product [Auanema sp. JU1783]|nr:unnamed protein product [Auanema sp. JU1783]
MVYKKGLHGPNAENRGPPGIRIERRFTLDEDTQSLGAPPTVPNNPPPADEISNGTTSSREIQSESRFFKSESKANSTKSERTSYVEEPASNTSTIERREQKIEKQRSLVRRITNDMQLAQYAQKMDLLQQTHPTVVYSGGVFTQAVYRIRSLSFIESGLRRMLWYLGKLVANHTFLFSVIPLILLALSVVGPVVNRDKLFISLPFSHLFGKSDVISNGYGVSRSASASFLSSNPAFTALNCLDQNSYAVLMKTINNKDSILRRDAVLAYTVLKRKIDDFPNARRDFLESCSATCELEKEMVDRIIKKSPQVALTYPETFVSMSKDSSNLSRVYLGSAIGGVETDTDGAISRAQSFLMTFQIRDDLDGNQKEMWTKNFIDQINHTSAGNISFFPWSPSSFHASIIDSLTSTHQVLLLSAVVVALFCFIASFTSNAYQSKPLVGFQIGFLILATCAFGLFVQSAFSFIYNPMLWPVFFVVVAIGLLYSFHLHLSWSRFSFASLHPTEKIAFILSYDGPGIASAITIISLSFGIVGIFVKSIHMQSTFVTLSSAVAALLFMLFMFLAVFLYMGGRREAKGVKWFQCFKTGDTHFTAPNLSDYDTSSLFSLHDRLLDNRPSLSRVLASQLIISKIRYPLVFICTVYLLIAAWGCSNVRVDLREEYFLPAESSPSIFLKDYKEMYGKTKEYLEVIIDQPIDYHDDLIQKQISDLLDWAVSNGFAARAISWLNEFKKFEKDSIYDVNTDTFVPVVNLVFLTTDSYKRFSSDITLDRFQTQIVRSRMYLELTAKGVNDRRVMVEQILEKASRAHLPVSVKAPFTLSLLHDMQTVSTVLVALGILMVCLFLFSLLCFGQPALTFLLLFTSAAVVMESVGYAVLWSVPLNIITFTMILAGNALTCAIVISFCFSYSASGKGQQRAMTRMQYTFQATFYPVLFACAVPIISYLPLFLIGSPIIIHIWKVLLINSGACIFHYLFFLPNLMIFLSEHSSLSCFSFSCYECCCDIDDDNSIYYIPTTGRVVHPNDGIYQTSYAYSVTAGIHPSPPNYLAIGPPSSVYGESKKSHRSRRSRRNSESSIGEAPPSSKMGRRRRKDYSVSSRNDSIYEAPPSPRQPSRSESPRRASHMNISQSESNNRYYDNQLPNMGQWRPFVPTQPFVFYPGIPRGYQGAPR